MIDILEGLVREAEQSEMEEIQAVRAWDEGAPAQVRAIRNWLGRRLTEVWRANVPIGRLMMAEGDFEAASLPRVVQRRLRIDIQPLIDLLVQRGLSDDKGEVFRRVLIVARTEGWTDWASSEGEVGTLICPSLEALSAILGEEEEAPVEPPEEPVQDRAEASVVEEASPEPPPATKKGRKA